MAPFIRLPFALVLAVLAGACREPVGPERAFLTRYAPPLHVAHRGGGEELPEATLYAYDFSLEELGTDVLEIDVRRTCDGHLVVAHDDEVGRTLMVNATIRTVSLDWLRTHEVPFPANPGPSPTTVRPIGDRKLLRVPTLDEVLDRYRNCLINLEVKEEEDTDEVIRSLQARRERELMVEPPGQAFDIDRNVCFASFSDHVGRKLQRAFPNACHTYPQSAAICAAVPRRLPGPLERDSISCPEYDLFTLPESDLLLTPQLMQGLHGMGRAVHVWTVNDPARMAKFLDLGADGVMTDRPADLRRVMNQRGLPTRQQRPDPRGPCVIRSLPLAEPAPGASVAPNHGCPQ